MDGIPTRCITVGGPKDGQVSEGLLPHGVPAWGVMFINAQGQYGTSYFSEYDWEVDLYISKVEPGKDFYRITNREEIDGLLKVTFTFGST
jgi:hypothetical protein